MIEVEKKFILSNKNKEYLIKDAEFLGEKVFMDIYYDTNDFLLTSNDRWLRSREGRFELKVPLTREAHRSVDQYDELEDEQKIKENLNLTLVGSMSDVLVKSGYSIFCTCKTTRRKYKKGSFNIDLDIVDLRAFIYNIGEIELMVDKRSEIESATDAIMSFAREQGLIITPVRGKVIEYLKRTKPGHYQTLIRAGVVNDF